MFEDQNNNNQSAKVVDDVVTFLPKARSQFVSILKIRNFMLFSISQAISLFGDKLDYMALLAMIAFFADKLGWQSARAISYLSVIITLPTILFGPLAGILIDRWNRIKVLITCDSFRTVFVASIPIIAITTKSLYLVYLITFIVFLFGLFFNTARLAIIPNLVARRRLLSANSFINFIGRISTFLGMFVGGLIVDWSFWNKIGIKYNWSAGFYIDSLTYLISVIVLSVIASNTNIFKSNSEQTRQSPAKKILLEASVQERKMLSEIKLALQYIKQTPPVLFIFSTIVILVIIGATAFVLIVPIIQSPAIDTKIGFGAGTKGVGFIGAVGAIGLVLSSMLYGIIGHHINKQNTILFNFIILGIITILIPILNSFIALIPLAFIAGLLLSPIFIIQDTMLHENIPESIRGRIFSSREWLLHLCFAIACLIVGELTNFFDKQYILYVAGSIVILCSSVFIYLIKTKKILITKTN